MSPRPHRRRIAGPQLHLRTCRALAVTVSVAAAIAIAAPAIASATTAGSSPRHTVTPQDSHSKPAPARTRVRRLPPTQIHNGTQPIHITLSGKLQPYSPRPRFTPSIAGHWTTKGSQEVFKAAATFAPCTTYRLTIPKQTTVEGHSRLDRTVTSSLQISCPPVRALQQALARLGYLPASLRPAHGTHVPHGKIGARKAAHLLYRPPHGTLAANIPGAPPLRYGSLDATTKGALMVFQEDHQIPVDGAPGAQTWAKLLAAVAHSYRNPSPYTFVTVHESSPETLQVHRGRHVVLTSPTNTGVPGAETAKGIFPIYARYTSTTMIGTNPDGTKYNDPGVPWVNYFNGGDAVHGFIRPGYGYPQSNGCVELPIETARSVYGMLRLGDIVYVT